MAALLELDGVSRRYEGVEDGVPGPLVLDGVSLGIEAGESVAVIGPSGSGKSTLLNIIGALDRPTAGGVRLDGQALEGLDETELARVRNEKIGFVFQSHHLLPQCTALENVLVPTLVHPDAAIRGEAPLRARQLLERVGLGPRIDHRPAQLSGGERQRVAVVRALINRPRLLLADEPTGSLDGAAAQSMADLLSELNTSEGVTLVTVTHSAALAAGMGRVLELSDGKLVTAEH